MPSSTATETAPPVDQETKSKQSSGEDSQRDSALVNVGDTVRASWRFSLDAIRSNIAYMRPEAKELLVWAFTWCIDPSHPLRFEEFCDRVTYAPNTVYKMYSGKYLHPESTPESKRLMDAPEKFLKNIRDFRRLELLRAKQGRKRFCVTPMVKRIYWAIDQARKSGRPVMMFGGSQIGKTEACKQNCIDFNHGKTILVEVEAVNGLRGLLQAIAMKLGISPEANTPDLIKRIKKALTRDMVLIIDEVHLLANVYRKGSFFACMEEIRRLWDAIGFGLVLTFTELGYDRIAEERKRELMQIFRRGVLRVNLGSAPSVADVKVITTEFGLPWGERHETLEIAAGVSDSPWEVLKQLSADEGLTAIIERIRMANELAGDQGREDVTWADFLIAHFAIAQQAQKPDTGWEKKGVAA